MLQLAACRVLCGVRMKITGRKKENYLDYVPRHNTLFPWKEAENGTVEIRMRNLGLTNRIAQKFFKKPAVSTISLDELGSFIWKEIDGKKTIYEIGILLKQRFGDRAEPLYERLSGFTKTLHNQKFIVYENKIRKKG